MCGFVGMVSSGKPAVDVHLALQALQHRGQDSAGIGTIAEAGDRFLVRRGLGAVPQALSLDAMESLNGPLAIGHVRYPTLGGGTLDDTQPFFYRVPGILMAHNGNITNFGELRKNLLERSIHLLSRCDVEPVLCEFADRLMEEKKSGHTLEDALAALRAVQGIIRGAYSLVIGLMLDGKHTLIVLRDPSGIRPATVGRVGSGHVAASETVALDALSATDRFEPEPGEAVFLRDGEDPIRHQLKQRSKKSLCVFEQIYFARPDAVLNDRSVYEVRLELGRELATRFSEKNIEIDVVVPVPDTARPAATALAEELKLPLREGFIKNRYSGRTFIMPDAGTRNAALRLKLNPIPSEVGGKRVLLVDDSIVRGTTLRRVVKLIRDAGAAEVHLAIHAPPVRNPCFYGIDMSTSEELFASHFAEETLEVDASKELGADSLTYLTIDGMDKACKTSRCAGCFDGVYPEPLPEADRESIRVDRERIERC